MTQESQPLGAVFLSYASEDADAASRLCETLRGAGIEVWFDRNELRGGDAWDSQIKRQIHECALFMPLISANTDARTEGYFRREWKLATRRMLDIADDAAFLVPVVVDSTAESDARVPEEFLGVHWTRLPGGEAPPAFAERVRQLLGGEKTAAHAVPHVIAARSEQGVRRADPTRSWRIGIALAALLVLGGGGLYWRYHDAGETPATPPTTDAASISPAASADTRPSIAVLPLENRSRLEDDVFFVDGIHDDILTKLSKVSGLRVISRTSVERFRGTDLGVKEIAAQLGVTSILEGGVQRAGNRVRINVQLIDARTDAHLWAEAYDRELTAATIFAIQSEVASAIASALNTALTPDEAARANAIPTQSLEAWEAYQLGRRLLIRRDTAELLEAEKMFRKAIHLDPGFALAHAGLADSLHLQASYSDVPFKKTLDKARTEAEAAVKIDATLSEAWTSLAGIQDADGNTEGAVQMYRRALELNPNNALALLWLGQLQLDGLAVDEAGRNLEKSAKLDPLSVPVRQSIGEALELRGRFEEAAKEYRRAIEINPSAAGPYESMAVLQAYALNRFLEAVPLAQKAVELDSTRPRAAFLLGLLRLDLGDDGKAFPWIEQATRRWPDNPLTLDQMADVERLRRDDAGAMRHTERALAMLPTDTYALAKFRDLTFQDGQLDDALARYRASYGEFLEPGSPRLNRHVLDLGIDIAHVLQERGDNARSEALLDSVAKEIAKLPRQGIGGVGIRDVRIYALRGDKARAIATLREAARAGWRFRWRYFREFDPALESIRNEPEFKAVFADIERDMARQRKQLADLRDGPLPEARSD